MIVHVVKYNIFFFLFFRIAVVLQTGVTGVYKWHNRCLSTEH